jgi:drug/metabolite transporter (DMT)-like permease
VSIGGGGAAFYRMFFAALSFFIILILTGNRVSLSPRDYIYSILTGSVLAFNYIVWHKSIHIVGPGIGSILTNTQIFFMVAVGVILFKEHITIPKVLAVLIGFLGIVALTNNLE